MAHAGDLTPAERVSAAIDTAAHEGPAVVVGIDGPGGAGKSTLARELSLLRDDVAVVSSDDFYRPLPEREALTRIEAVDLAFDWERLHDEVLAPLLRGEDARYRRSDWLAGRARRGARRGARYRRRGGGRRLRRAARAARIPRPSWPSKRPARSASPVSWRAASTIPLSSSAGAAPRSGTSSIWILGTSQTS